MLETMSAPLSHPELHAPSKRTRTNALIRDAVNNGKPLPLMVMLENMWHYRDEAIRLQCLRPGDEGYDPLIAKACRMAAQKCANDAAPFVHPKLTNVAIRPEDEEEAQDRKDAARVTADSLRGKSVTELGRLFLQITKGEDVDADDTTPISDDDHPDPPTDTVDEAQTEVLDTVIKDEDL